MMPNCAHCGVEIIPRGTGRTDFHDGLAPEVKWWHVENGHVHWYCAGSAFIAEPEFEQERVL